MTKEFFGYAGTHKITAKPSLGGVNIVATNAVGGIAGATLNSKDGAEFAVSILEWFAAPGVMESSPTEAKVLELYRMVRKVYQERERQAAADAMARNAKAERERQAAAAADIRRRVEAVKAKRKARLERIDADAWELFKALNPDTSRTSIDGVNPHVADDFRKIARRAQQLNRERR